MSTGDFFIASLFPSIFEFSGSRACARARTRFTPKSGYFCSEKRAKKARIRYTRVASGLRANEAVRRTSTGTERTKRSRGMLAGGRGEGEGKERERERIKSKTAVVAKGK